METQKGLAHELEIHPRWLPDGIHGRKIAEWIEMGRCHIQHRGHNACPLLVFEDGGTMELITVRWKHTERGWNLVSISASDSRVNTNHYDVCGTVDAIKSALEQNPDGQSLESLVDDIEMMLERMAGRRNEYTAFFEGLSAIASSPLPDSNPGAQDVLARLRGEIRQGPLSPEKVAFHAESIRNIAQSLENSLAECRRLAVDAVNLVRIIQGARNWDTL